MDLSWSNFTNTLKHSYLSPGPSFSSCDMTSLSNLGPFRSFWYMILNKNNMSEVYDFLEVYSVEKCFEWIRASKIYT